MRRLLMTVAASVALVVLLGLAGCSPPGAGMLRKDGGSGDTASASKAQRAAEARKRMPTMVVLDASGSMKADDAPGQRFAAAQKAVTDLTGQLRKGHPIGLMTYGTRTGNTDAEKPAGCKDVTRVLPVAPLDKTAYDAAVAQLRPRGYTPIGTALQQAASALPTKGDRAIVLISDGVDTCAPPAPCDVAKTLHRSQPDLAISTVGFRVGGDAQAQLECIAEATGGSYLDATSGPVLGSRLAALFDPDAVARSIQPTGYRSLDLGMTAAQARAAADARASRATRSALGDVPAKGRVEIRYVDCTLVFQDGVLTAIRSTKSGEVSTVDGTTVGDQVSDVLATYGSSYSVPEPGVLQVPADTVAGTGYEIRYDADPDSSTPSGKVTTITLCRCAPTLGIGMVAFNGDTYHGGAPIWNGADVVRTNGLLSPSGELGGDLVVVGFVAGRVLYVNHLGAHGHGWSLHLVDPRSGRQVKSVDCELCDTAFVDGERIVAIDGYKDQIHEFDANLVPTRDIAVDQSQFADPEVGWDGYGDPAPDFTGAGVIGDHYYVFAHPKDHEGDLAASPRLYRLDNSGVARASSADVSIENAWAIGLTAERVWLAQSNGSVSGLDADSLDLEVELQAPGSGATRQVVSAIYARDDAPLTLTQGSIWTYRRSSWEASGPDGGGIECIGDVGGVRVVGGTSPVTGALVTVLRGDSVVRRVNASSEDESVYSGCVVDVPPALG